MRSRAECGRELRVMRPPRNMGHTRVTDGRGAFVLVPGEQQRVRVFSHHLRTALHGYLSGNRSRVSDKNAPKPALKTRSLAHEHTNASRQMHPFAQRPRTWRLNPDTFPQRPDPATARTVELRATSKRYLRAHEAESTSVLCCTMRPSAARSDTLFENSGGLCVC